MNEEDAPYIKESKPQVEGLKNKVPSLNFKQLPVNNGMFDEEDNNNKMKVRIPKMDLNLKNVSP
jgi:hypothetical protein